MNNDFSVPRFSQRRNGMAIAKYQARSVIP